MDSGWNGNISYAAIAVAVVVTSAYPLYQSWRTRREERALFAIHTAMDDLDVLGRDPLRSKLAGTAVVVGGR